jgi:hypothetical protein
VNGCQGQTLGYYENPYSTGPWGQCYKTFYRSNLPSLNDNTVILYYKAVFQSLGNYLGMSVNYDGANIRYCGNFNIKYCGNLRWNLTL